MVRSCVRTTRGTTRSCWPRGFMAILAPRVISRCRGAGISHLQTSLMRSVVTRILRRSITTTVGEPMGVVVCLRTRMGLALHSHDGVEHWPGTLADVSTSDCCPDRLAGFESDGLALLRSFHCGRRVCAHQPRVFLARRHCVRVCSSIRAAASGDALLRCHARRKGGSAVVDFPRGHR